MQVSLDIMLEFKPPRGAFIMYINNRKLIDTFLKDIVGLNKKNNLLKVFSGHCTGKIAYDLLKSQMKDKLDYFSTGCKISI